ncbi:hypothetical protein WOLCODRAFT_140916 [Wolfiporia cocos MD-104 SS10]|uniref:Uncharacterized protein n=1 Tax=Wolfiporia cocos (strain MD-104) TaxID=742152 RepID=A0A2H3J6J0_WOLCO|nr:hypothetical protein WOLCODRAFT_140916 [Wolfiporia cocos MD-104 SS10]
MVMSADESQQHKHEETNQDDLMSYFDRSATAVRRKFLQFEKEYARPALSTTLQSFRDHPIFSTFIAVFLSLSLLPALAFIGFSLFIFASFSFIALACAILASSIVIMLTGTILISVLLIVLGASIFLTASGTVTYLLLRLAWLVYQNGAHVGLFTWAHEGRALIFRSKLELDVSDHREEELQREFKLGSVATGDVNKQSGARSVSGDQPVQDVKQESG